MQDIGYVIDGVFDLTVRDEQTVQITAERLSWLRAYYERQGLEADGVVRDVLQYGHRTGFLNDMSFSRLLALYHYRLELIDTRREAGVANEGDPWGPHPADRTFPICRSKVLSERDLPRVQCRPFTPMSRPRAWTQADVRAAIARGLPNH